MPKRTREHEERNNSTSDPKKTRKEDQTSGETPCRQILRCEDYTVGWICALQTEHLAAVLFLDEQHEDPEDVSPQDHNSYTLGRIGKHNVVIAVLPDGEYGISSATSVIKDMLHSFDNVRIGLMVGVGGGAPTPEHDIRLGDIVVSSAGNPGGGVVQYDFGKTIQDQEFHLTGHLNQPPAVLRTALSKLRTKYEVDGHQLNEAIDHILMKRPKLKGKYKRPDSGCDRLYKSSAVHPLDKKASCSGVCDADPLNLISRPERGEEDDDPTIHYGLIASANQVMKDASVRDNLAAEKDILCFEMEAAGLMNQFPCLVIRGICDYADSHKNKEWQGYAAMVAAAYAKDLLSCVHPTKVAAERNIRDLLGYILDAKAMASETKDDVKHLVSKKRHDDMYKWLSPSDPSTNLGKALGLRHEGTGHRFLQSAEYLSWKTSPKSTLWVNGKVGCGKTILSSTIIEDLQTSSSPTPFLVYFYFDFNDAAKQSHESMIRSLVYQLYNKATSAGEPLDSSYSACHQGRSQLSTDSLCRTFRLMISLAGEVCIILDALDECVYEERKRLYRWMQDLNGADENVRLIATSRPEEDIQSSMLDVLQADVITLEGGLLDTDVRNYIQRRVREDNGLSRWRTRPDVQTEIESSLTEKAGGMFRWAACQLDALEDCLDYRMLREALRTLPKTIDETYFRILDNIHPDHLRHAIRILQFLVFSERPLRLDEAVDALVVQTNTTPRFNPQYRMPLPREISRYCSSLVVIVEREDFMERPVTEIQLSHFSVKEWLLSNRLDMKLRPHFTQARARAEIAMVCLAYLRELDPHVEIHTIKRAYPLSKYAAVYWPGHAAVGERTVQEVTKMAMELFSSQVHFSASIQLHDPGYYSRNSSESSQGFSCLYFASKHGLIRTTRCLIDQDADVNAQGGNYSNALRATSYGGHKEIIKLLLERGADINAQGGECGSALQAASITGHTEVIELLLENGADVNAQGGSFANPLHVNSLQVASIFGHREVVELLLERGANVNAQGGFYGNALQAALSIRHKEIVKVLLETGADANAQGGFYGTALQTASSKGHKEFVELLLAKDAHPNAHGGLYGSALQAASAGGYKEVVELLLENGADVDVQGGFYGSAIQAATTGGHRDVFQLLLRSANGDALGAKSGYPIQLPSHREQRELLALLEKDICSTGQGGHHGWDRCDAMFRACMFEGHRKVAKFLHGYRKLRTTSVPPNAPAEITTDNIQHSG